MSDDMPRVSITVPEDVLFQEVNDQAALLHLGTEVYYGLDDVGARMWRALERAGSIDGACAELAAVYEVEPQRLREDVAALVEQLRGHGLIEVADG